MKVLSKYKSYYSAVFILIFFISCKEIGPSKTLKTATGNALGTTYAITYESSIAPITIQQELNALLKRVNTSMSTYIPESDISKINRGDTTVIVDVEFKTVYTKAKEVWKHSNGAFDPTVGALVNIWGFGPEKQLNTVQQKQIDSVLNFTGFNKVDLSKENKIIKQHKALYLDFNALAKGYTIDLIGQMLTENGIANYLIELGGEILAQGINTKVKRPWRVAIDHPVQKDGEGAPIARIMLKDKAIATSGNYRKFRVDPETGTRYVHIIDPRTGYPQKSNVLSVSVVASTCMEADAYATAFMLMPPEKIRMLAKQLHLEVYIVNTDNNGNLKVDTTTGFRALMLDE